MTYRNGGDWTFTPPWQPTVPPPSSPPPLVCAPAPMPVSPVTAAPISTPLHHDQPHHHGHGGGLLLAMLLLGTRTAQQAAPVDPYPPPAWRDPYDLSDEELRHWDSRGWTYDDPFWQTRFRAAVAEAHARNVPPPVDDITDHEMVGWYRRGWRWHNAKVNRRAQRLVDAADIADAIANPHAARASVKRRVDAGKLTWGQAFRDPGWLARKIGRTVAGWSSS